MVRTLAAVALFCGTAWGEEAALKPEVLPEPATGAGKWVGDAEFGAPWEGIPEPYRRLPIGQLQIPKTRAEWERRRAGIRKILFASMGEIPPRPKVPRAKILSREKRDGCTVERIDIENGLDAVITSYLVIPDGIRRPAPAVLLLHGHSYTKESSFFKDEQNVLESLKSRGYIMLAIDSYFGGERVGTGPGGDREKTVELQRDSLFKLYLLFGRTLWGMMFRDNQIALDYLETRPEVDRTRLAASGMSMGSTGAWWPAALDERVKATVGVACFTRYTDLIAAGQLRAHAIYYFVPEILRHFDSEAVIGLIAPRAFLALTGDGDPTSPPSGMRVLEEKVGQIYGLYNAGPKFRSIVYPGVKHAYTGQMKEDQAVFLDRWLK